MTDSGNSFKFFPAMEMCPLVGAISRAINLANELFQLAPDPTMEMCWSRWNVKLTPSKILIWSSS